ALERQQRSLDMVRTMWERERYAPARRQWIMGRVALSDGLWEAGRKDEAVAGYRAALTAAQQRLADRPGHPQGPRPPGGSAEQRLGDAGREMGRWSEEVVHDGASLAVDEALAKEAPGSAETQRDLATDHTRLGVAKRSAGDAQGALAEQRLALDIRQALLKAD